MSKQIALTQGKYAIVDDEDYERVSKRKWYAHKEHNSYYARTSEPKTNNTIYLHTFVMRARKGQPIDHINGNGLDCQKENLRYCTQLQNRWNRARNKSNRCGFKGVTTQGAKYVAKIKVFGRQIHLGTFDNPRDAARAYNIAARKYFGIFARLNDV